MSAQSLQATRLFASSFAIRPAEGKNCCRSSLKLLREKEVIASNPSNFGFMEPNEQNRIYMNTNIQSVWVSGTTIFPITSTE